MGKIMTTKNLLGSVTIGAALFAMGCFLAIPVAIILPKHERVRGNG